MNKRVLVPIDLGGCNHSCLLSPPQRPTAEPEFIEALIESYRRRYGNVDEVFFVHGGLPSFEQIEACRDIPIRLGFSPVEFLKAEAWDYFERISSKVCCVEIDGLSSNNLILKFCDRGYTSGHQMQLFRHFREYNVRISYTIATGLPNSTHESMNNDMDFVLQQNPDLVRIHPTQAWEGARLARFVQKEQWSVDDRQTLFEVREWLSFLESKNITVSRIGLQPKHDIPITVVSGPRVDNLRMKVGYSQFFDRMAGAVASDGHLGDVVILVNPKDLALAKGVENDNIRCMRARLGYADIRLEVDERVRRGDVQLKGSIE